MTPESSPQASRISPTPRPTESSLVYNATPEHLNLMDTRGASTPSRSDSVLSSPFVNRSSSERPIHVDDVFAARTSFSQQPLGPASTPPVTSGGEMERIRRQMRDQELAYQQEAEKRRPDYLKRARRNEDIKDVSMDDQDLGLPGVGITTSPMKGRRLQLFQETSEESFEESLMAGGYGRYVSVRPY